MNKPLLLIGALIALIMCVVPPQTVTEYDREGHRIAGMVDQAIEFEGPSLGGAPEKSEYVTRSTSYRPLWAASTWEAEGAAYAAELDGSRLLVQLLIVLLSAGALSFIAGQAAQVEA